MSKASELNQFLDIGGYLITISKEYREIESLEVKYNNYISNKQLIDRDYTTTKKVASSLNIDLKLYKMKSGIFKISSDSNPIAYYGNDVTVLKILYKFMIDISYIAKADKSKYLEKHTLLNSVAGALFGINRSKYLETDLVALIGYLKNNKKIEIGV